MSYIFMYVIRQNWPQPNQTAILSSHPALMYVSHARLCLTDLYGTTPN